jgi:methylthioribose-1-phosphate isomerase
VLSPVFWREDRVVILDQRRLPDEEVWTAYGDWEEVARAIAEMEVRGAPAIGCAAGFAVALACRRQPSAATRLLST